MTFRLPSFAALSVAFGVFTSACSESTAPPAPPPPPLPSVSIPPAPSAPSAPAPAEPTEAAPTSPASPAQAQADRTGDTPSGSTSSTRPTPAAPATGGKPGKSGVSLYDLAARGEATLPTSAPLPSPVNSGAAAKPSKPAAPAPVQPAPAPNPPAPAKPKTKVVVPSTAHVKVDVPAGLQSTLDLDPRMQPWLNQVIKVIDGCYTKELKSNASAAGTIQVRITMHSESRPDADVKSLPPALSGVVACATGGLMRTKMPLFTGKEGEKHNVNIRFEK